MNPAREVRLTERAIELVLAMWFGLATGITPARLGWSATLAVATLAIARAARVAFADGPATERVGRGLTLAAALAWGGLAALALTAARGGALVWPIAAITALAAARAAAETPASTRLARATLALRLAPPVAVAAPLVPAVAVALALAAVAFAADDSRARRHEREWHAETEAAHARRARLEESLAHATRQARLERARASELARRVAGPLEAMAAAVRALGVQRLSAPARRLAAALESHAESLRSALGDATRDGLAAPRQAFDPWCVSGEVLTAADPLARAAGVTLRDARDPAIADQLAGDPAPLRGVLAELLRAGIACARGGEAVFELRVLAAEQERLALWCAVHVATGDRAGDTAETALRACRRLAAVMDGRAGALETRGAGATYWAELHFERLPLGMTIPPADDWDDGASGAEDVVDPPARVA